MKPGLRDWLNNLDAPGALRMLLILSVCFGVLGVVCIVLGIWDQRVLDNGQNVWIKPLRFCVAFGMHLATIWWLARLTRRIAVADRWFAFSAWLQAGTATLELACIVLQAGRGVHSHFNYATSLDHAIFSIMGVGTAVLMAGILLMIAGLVRWPADRVSTWATVGGLAIAVMGGLVGVWMVLPTPEQHALLATGERLPWVGKTLVATASGDSLPLFGWDLGIGDWRVSHFVGLHALQALPLLAWLHLRAGSAGASVPAAIWFGGAAYLAAFLGSLIWTAQGHSIFDRSLGAFIFVGLPMFAFLASALYLCFRRRAQSQHENPG